MLIDFFSFPPSVADVLTDDDESLARLRECVQTNLFRTRIEAYAEAEFDV